MFGTVLIANRGEIARRVMRTCRDLGIRTVAVYSDADADEPHVREADEAVRIGPAPAVDSYLDVEAVVEAAARTGAEAIHPGYGFLSENPRLPAACEEAGITFVGPRAEVMRLMGDKAAAKARLAEAGVPVVPGRHEALDDDELAKAADEIGFPVLLKAVAGGGGKGMRAVHDPDGLQEAIDAARREAAGAFDDDRLIVERLVDRPRHVEVQVVGDGHGNVIHVLERECSIQRRHQKVIEETPSPAVDDALRRRMGDAAVTAAAAVDYVGAGTIEFILSDPATADGSRADEPEFYFLEMNTRLQVEHPVTELITGIDLVELQLRVAAGEALPLAQDDVSGSGHAIEARLYAEDPANDYLPQTGTVHRFAVPSGPGVRVDSGVESGSVVSRFYDPMLAKLVVHGPDRSVAIDRMSRLLERTVVLGTTTNRELLAAAIRHPAFASGELTTSFLDDHLADWRPEPTPAALVIAAAVALARHHRDAAAGGSADVSTSPWRLLGPWRTGGVGGWRLTLADPTARDHGDDGDPRHRVVVRRRGPDWTVTLGAADPAAGATDSGTDHRVHVAAEEDGVLHLDVDGREIPTHAVVLDSEDRTDVWVQAGGLSRRLRVVPPTRHRDPGMAAAGAAFTAPMPGAVLVVDVTAGDHVAAGTTMMVVEAMKMEHPITAPVDGTVTAVHVDAGDPVDGDQPLLEFEPDDAGDGS